MQRRIVHDKPVNFRVNAALLAQAEKVADQEGMNFSELMRHALRNQLREAA